MIPRRLYFNFHKKLIKEHLCSLQGRDRYLRFGTMASDQYIIDYVERCWDSLQDDWFGVVEDGCVIAAVHIARSGHKSAELGLSVDPRWRGRGLGQALFERAVINLRGNFVKEVFMHCLSENTVMKHIAAKNHMKLFTEYGETDADLILPDSTILEPYHDALIEQIALYDNSLRYATNALKIFTEDLVKD